MSKADRGQERLSRGSTMAWQDPICNLAIDS